MTHQALARKWRPRDFPSVVGQDHVVKALVHALDHQRLHHAYLLTGTRGVGKTTLARILAKAVNCETGVSSRPCGVCSACTGIDTGRFPDYMELDAASNRSVDEMTQVLETAVYAPTMGRYKVYVIDEVHMLSNHAFNAMLKTLEEPPPHVLFVLATTDPQKVPVTVLSRCLQLGLKNMTAQAISGHLADILQKENITFEPQALAWIGKAARGSMRDALSLTDQAVTYASGQVLDVPTREMLGIVAGDQVLGVFDALAEGDAAKLLLIADQMQAQAASFSQALMQVAERCQSLGWMQQGIQPAEPDAQMEQDAQRFDPLDLQVFYQIAVHGARDLGLAPDPYTGFTMSLLRLLAFRSEPAATSLSNAGSGAGSGAGSAGQGSAAAAARRPAQPLAVKPASQAMARPAVPAPGMPPRPPMPERQMADRSMHGARPASNVQNPAGSVRSMPAGRPAERPSESDRPPEPPPEGEPAPRRSPSGNQGYGPSGNSDDSPPWHDSPADALAASATAAGPSVSSGMGRVASQLLADAGFQAEQAPAPVPRAATARNLAPAPAPVPVGSFDGDWPALAALLPLAGVPRMVAQQSQLLACKDEGEGLNFRLRVGVKILTESMHVIKVREALAESLCCAVNLQVELGEVQGATAESIARQAQDELIARTQSQLESLPVVRGLMEHFDGKIIPGTVKPA